MRVKVLARFAISTSPTTMKMFNNDGLTHEELQNIKCICEENIYWLPALRLFGPRRF